MIPTIKFYSQEGVVYRVEFGRSECNRINDISLCHNCVC